MDIKRKDRFGISKKNFVRGYIYFKKITKRRFKLSSVFADFCTLSGRYSQALIFVEQVAKNDVS